MNAVDPAATWIRLSEAIRLGLPPRTAQRRIASGEVVSQRAGGERRVLLASLPSAIQARYGGVPHALTVPQAEVAADDWRRRLSRFAPEVREALRAEADRRGQLLERYRSIDPKWVREDGRAMPAPAVQALLAEWPARDPRVLLVFPSWARVPSERTIRTALAEYEAGGALRLVRAAPERRTDDPRRATISPELHRRIEVLRYDEHPHATFASLMRKLSQEFGAKLPSRDTLRRYIARTWSGAQDVFERQGARTYVAKAQPHIVRDADSVEPGEIFVGDHRQFDVEVMNPARGGQLERPWITCWFDVGSRAPAGWVIGFEPNARAIAEAFAIAVAPKADARLAGLCGLPACVYQDNGKDFRADAVVTVFREYGVRLVLARPFNAKAKIVERFFGVVATMFDRDFPSYLGNTPAARTERVRELRKVHERWLEHREPSTPFLSLDAFRARFAAWVFEYLAQPSEGLRELATGRACSPQQRLVERRFPVKLPDARSLAMLSWASVERTVRRGMLKVDRAWVYSAAELLRFDGQKVDLRRDPQDVRRGIVATRDGTLIEVHAQSRLPYVRPGHDDAVSLAQVKEANREARRAQKVLEAARAERRREEERRARGSSILSEVVERSSAPAAPPPESAPTPAGAVHQLHPLDRIARAQRAATPAPASDAFTSPPPAESDAEYVARVLGPRPALDEFVDRFTRRRVEAEQAEWDQTFARLVAARGHTAGPQGG